jgi:hypothetical protein
MPNDTPYNPYTSAWTEFADQSVVDWKRVRAALEHENLLINQRFTWLLSCQGLLLAGYVLAFQSSVKPANVRPELVSQIVLFALAFAGILTSLFLSRGIHAAHQQHDVLKRWWVDNYIEKKTNPSLTLHPPICGNEPTMWVTLHYHQLPIVFLLVWVILGIAAFFDQIAVYREQVGFILFITVTLTGVAGIGYLIGRRRAVQKA